MTALLAQGDLVGDLGGTHLRLGRWTAGAVCETSVLRWADTAGLVEAVQHYLAGASAPAEGCFAVAAPVHGTRVRLTNADVAFCAEAVRDLLGMDRLLLVNDAQALARSLGVLEASDAAQLGAGELQRHRTMVVIAPGTGLGVAALVPAGSGPVVVSGEGGHIGLPATALGLPVAQALLRLQHHVSAEDLLSGSGLPTLDVVVRVLRGERDPRPRTAAEVTASGDAQVLDVFVDLLAAVVQAHVLTFGAWGGAVLGGGFLPQLVPLLRDLGLHERFARHPKMGSRLANVPVVVDTRGTPALAGAALLLQDARADDRGAS